MFKSRIFKAIRTNFNLGTSHHHPDGQEPANMLEIRSQQCAGSLYWCCTSWSRDRRGATKNLSVLENQTRLWFALQSVSSIRTNKISGLTETCTVVCSSSEEDIWFGSSGSLQPGFNAKIMSIEGVEITGYDQPGELVVQSPSVVIGYLNNDKANKETFIDDTDGKGRWMRTGDEAVIRKAPSGNEHIFIVDRIKELIKVKVGIKFHLQRLQSNNN